MGNGQVLRRAQEIYSDLSTNADRNYTKVCSLVPETPDRYRSHRRFDKFRVNRGATRPVWAVAIAEVNMMMAAATADHEIHLWDLETMELKVSLKGHSDQVWEVKFSTNETTLASASSDKTLRLWDTQDGSPLGVLRGHTAAIRCLSFSYEGYLISGDQDANLFLWEAENAQPIKQWQAHEGCVHSVTFSPADPLMAISVGAEGSVASWYVKREEDDVVLGGRFPGGDGGAVLSLTAHPAYPGVVAVGCEDGDVWIWGFKPDFQEGNADVAGHTKLKGHTKAVWFLEFSRDACLLASASADCTVRVWNATNVQLPSLLSVFRAHDSWVRQVRWFTQPGKGLGRKRLLVTCSTDGSVSIWAPLGRLRKINKLQAAPNFGCKDVGCEAEVVQLPLVAHEETPQPGSKLPPAPLALPSSETQLQPMPEETATPRDPRDPRNAVPPQAAPPAAAPMPSQTAMPREAAPTAPTPPTPEMTWTAGTAGTAGTGTTKGTAVPVAPPSAVKAPEGAALGPVREGAGSQLNLFGAAPSGGASSSSSLFGAAPTGGANSGGSLFGAAPSGGASSSSSLFGAAPSGGASSSSSLFGAAPTGGASSGGSLFGAAPSGGASSGGSLFGSAPSGGASSGGLFGAASGGGNLFGASAGQSSGTNLFGAGSASSAFGAGSGGATFGASSGGSELQQARATVVEHRKVSDLLRMWEERIHKQAQHFDAFAEQVLRFDTDLIANAAKVKVLREEHAQLKGRQELVDRSLQQIWEQQDSLGRLLSGLVEALRPQPQQADEAAGSAAAPIRSHQRALALTLQLDELERQAEDLARETGKIQSNLYKEPLTTVVRVLDAHASALDTMSTQVTAVTQRIQVIEGAL